MAMPMTKGRGLRFMPRAMGMTRGTMMAVVAVLDMMLVSMPGGERQRISLARAMLKDAPVIILDEATASVDPENERQLQEAFEALTRDKTVIMIAHRLSTVRKADQILVLDKGRIIQRGRHEELMEQGGLYADFIRIREQAVGWSL